MGNCINFIKIDQGFQSIPLIGLSTLNRNKSRINLNSSKEQSWKKITVEDFKFLKILGQGSYGKIFLVQKKDSKKLYAIKCMRKPVLKKPAEKINSKIERIILEKIRSPFLVQLKYAFQSDTKLYLVMDFVEGRDLSYHISFYDLTKSQIKLWVSEIVLALECLHENNIIYRDLKPENVLLDKEGHIKLTDFGLSKFLKEENLDRAFSFCGTPEYLAPEIIRQHGYNHMVDWWCLGSLIYELIFKKPPFYCESRVDMYFEIVHQDLEIDENLDPVLKNFIKALLQKNPKDRLGAKGIEEIKNHNFFHGISWNAVKNKEHSFYKPKQCQYGEQNKGEFNYSISLTSYDDGNDMYTDYTYDNTYFKVEKEENGISIACNQ